MDHDLYAGLLFVLTDLRVHEGGQSSLVDESYAVIANFYLELCMVWAILGVCCMVAWFCQGLPSFIVNTKLFVVDWCAF